MKDGYTPPLTWIINTSDFIQLHYRPLKLPDIPPENCLPQIRYHYMRFSPRMHVRETTEGTLRYTNDKVNSE